MVWERRIALIYHWQLSVTANEDTAQVENGDEDDDDDDEKEEHVDYDDYLDIKWSWRWWKLRFWSTWAPDS